MKELRIALALNGGVSLAIWIGGVADELLRLVNAGQKVLNGESDPQNPYVEICQTLGVIPVVDVITGTSAGGINGVFLALGMIWEHESLTTLRDLWIEAGSFELLLHDPLDAKIESLMKGEDYFLPRLMDAVVAMQAPGVRVRPAQHPRISVSLTATSLEGDTTEMHDVLGNVLYDTDHHVSFRFDEEDLRSREKAEVLARACRSTGSFPGAFEPSPVDADAASLRESIEGTRGHAHLVDGGVLANLPVSQAIDAIVAQPSREHVDRVLALVVPDPGGAPPARSQPDVGGVIAASLIGIPRTQSLHGVLEEVRFHNLNVRSRRAARRALLADDVDPADLRATARALHAAYVASRREAVAQQVANSLHALLRRNAPQLPGNELTRLNHLLGGSDLPQRVLEAMPVESQPAFIPRAVAVGGDDDDWCWGASALRRLITVLVGTANVSQSSLGDTYSATKAKLGTLLQGIDEQFPPGRGLLGGLVFEALRASPEISLSDGITAARAEWVSGPIGGCTRVRWLNDRLNELGAVAVEMAEKVGDGSTGLLRMCRGQTPRRAANLLVSLEVIEMVFAGFEARTEQEIGVIQITSIPQAPIDDVAKRRNADNKLAGVQLGHFGAFLKRSWRANDWTWGRLDAATRLVDLLHRCAGALDDAEVRRTTIAAQRSILIGELPALADQIENDSADGSPPSPAARILKDEVRASDLATLNAPQMARLLALNRLGNELVRDEISSDLASRTALKALAAATTVGTRKSPKLLRGPLAVTRSASVLAWWAAQLSKSAPTLGVAVGLMFGLGVAGATLDLFTDVRLGPLAPLAWLALTALLMVGVIRAPLLAVPLLVLGVIPGLLSMLPRAKTEWGWWPKEQVPWPHVPRLTAAVFFTLAFAFAALVRRFAFLDQQLRSIRQEQARLACSPARTWFAGTAAAGPGAPGMLALLLIVSAVVLVKNAALAGWIPRLGGDDLLSLLSRNMGVLALVVGLVFAAFKRSAIPNAVGLWIRWRRHEWILVVVIALSSSTALLIGSDVARWALVLVSVAALAFLGKVSLSRWKDDVGRDASTSQAFWSIVLAWLVVTVATFVSLITGDRNVDGEKLIGMLFGTALLEELIFRGGLQGAAIRARKLWLRAMGLPFAFGMWHLVDAIHDTKSHPDWDDAFVALFVIGTVVAMTVVSGLLFQPLRLRSGSIVGPWLLHASVLCSLSVLGYSAPLTPKSDAAAKVTSPAVHAVPVMIGP